LGRRRTTVEANRGGIMNNYCRNPKHEFRNPKPNNSQTGKNQYAKSQSIWFGKLSLLVI
jgi:hypothetical protein